MRHRALCFTCAILIITLQPLLAQPGPFAVTQDNYGFGNLAFQPTGFPGRVGIRPEITLLTLSRGPAAATPG